MKKFAVILVLLSITRIGVAYADTNSSTTYFFGEKNATANLNQVLALLIGPKGDPGPAGVAGKNGFNGMNGKDGKDGLPGAPGAVGAQGLIGPPGASVLVASFSGVRGPCTNGGYSATDGNGNVVYSCNGTNGSNGTGGGGVTNIINQYGSDSSTSPLDYGEAVLKTSTCEADNTVYIKPTTYFTGSAFYYQEIKLGDRNSSQTNSKADIHSTCAGKFAYFYFTMEAADSSGSTRYAIDDVVACKFEFPVANDGRYTATGMWQFSINDSNSSCGVYGQLILSGGKKVMTKLNSPSFSFELSDINTKDTKDMMAFEIASS